MAYNQEQYDGMKSAYERMTDEQKKQAVEQYKDNAEFQSFAKDYAMGGYGKSVKSMQSTPMSNPAPVENNQQDQTFDNGQNWGNQNQNQSSFSENNNQQTNYNQNQTFDSSKMSNPNAQVQVQAGNAKQTGRPDFHDDSDQRMEEITNNLNAYWNTNREYFADRQTFDKVFSYNERSKAQQAHFDSFRKRKEDSNKVAGYVDGKSVYQGMQNGELTKDQMTILQQQFPEIYKQYQEKLKEVENLRIVNKTVPNDITDNAELIQSLVDKLNIESGDPYKIHQNFLEGLEKYGVLKDNQRLASYQDKITNVYTEIAEVEQKIRSQSSGASESLIQARIHKATSSLYGRATALQQGYSTILQGRQQNLAIATAETNSLIQQSNEDQRIWNNKLKGLGFAMEVASYETPEQKRQAELRQLEAKNNLELKNKEAEVLLKNKLQSQLSDLSTSDPEQLKANLNNALTPYFEKYGAIIMRSQAGVVEDVLALAQKEGISVAKALEKNFIAPLQAKKEYKMMLNKQMGYDPSQSITKIGESNYITSTNPDGTLNIQPFYADQTTQSFSGSGMKGAGLRNNNPGNIKDMGFGNPIGKDVRGFAQFATPEDGFDALVEKIKNNQNNPKSRYYGKTIAEYFKLYAPSSDGNNPINYAKSVAKQLGVSVNTKISDLDPIEFAKHIAKHDSGYNYSTYGQFRGQTGVGGEFEPLYRNYLSTGQLPSDSKLKAMGGLQKFIKDAQAYKESAGEDFETKEQKKEIADLRKEFNNLQEVKDFKKIEGMYKAIKSASAQKTAAGDLSLIFAYMKILDPNSTVREGEFANAQNAGGVDDRITNLYNKVIKGTRLSDKQRQDFVATAGGLYNNYATSYNTKLKEYKGYSIEGGDAKRIGSEASVYSMTGIAEEELADRYGSGSLINGINTTDFPK